MHIPLTTHLSDARVYADAPEWAKHMQKADTDGRDYWASSEPHEKGVIAVYAGEVFLGWIAEDYK